jgi:hypothetical protein
VSPIRRFLLVSSSALLIATSGACGDGAPPVRTDAGARDAAPFDDAGRFVCLDVDSQACVGSVHKTCVRDGEFLASRDEDCAATGKICVPGVWCVVCRPDEVGCFEGNAARCRPDGSGWDVTEECDLGDGFVCRDGTCQNLCELALRDRSYQGCEFYAVDLDNAAIRVGSDASAQPYAVVVSNPGTVRTEVTIEANDGPVGGPPMIRVVDRQTVLPGDLEVFVLPRREVDGSSPTGLNDGTHTALTSNAYRVRSTLPIVAYQFNPLDNVSVFSNDASLLIPTSAIDTEYAVVGWPQTIAHTSNPETDFDPTRTDEGLRAFLTIVGTQPRTQVTLRFGPWVGRAFSLVAGEFYEPNQEIVVTLGPFDVLNLETDAFNADFTGTRVTATAPVTVFVGSEASDAPRFDTLATRQCCADHLEEQLPPLSTLGREFIVARSPRRSVALNAAFLDPTRNSVAEVNEPEWIRVLAVEDTTVLTTSLPPPQDRITLLPNEDVILRVDQDFILRADRPVVVLQAQSSQNAVGIPSEYPGGDPSIVFVPPTPQYRRDYVLLTPDKYAFDFITIIAPVTARVLLDGAPPPPSCEVAPADGIRRMPGEAPPDFVIYRCQLSFPDVIGRPNVRVEEGEQNDGVHTVVADQPVGVMVTGFDAYVSYAYYGGLNLQRIN